ncbi:MAG: class I SAM-dependent methyltransferase [Planctomycetota bacterium]
MVDSNMLHAIELPSSIDQIPLPSEIQLWMASARQRIQTFQDRWNEPQIEQFVAADYELVFQALVWLLDQKLANGNRFLEWGCGFSVVACLAASLGLDAVGIESEEVLLKQGRRTVQDCKLDVELIHGNFLPKGAEEMADDPTLPSLWHPVACGYRQLQLDLDDFAIVYSYPWPGEEDFHQQVFLRHASPGALLLQFHGPNQMSLWRATMGPGRR